MRPVIVIPARYESSRFPGKPLERICGIPMIERVWRIASAVPQAAVVVATDDERIVEAVAAFGGRAVLTSPACRNGTERVWDALQQLPESFDAVINFQGDAVLTPPWILTHLLDALRVPGAEMVTPAVQVSPEECKALQAKKQAGSSSGTLVVFDRQYRALYFSKAFIPYIRTAPATGGLPVYRHIGMYGYSLPALEAYLHLPQGVLEQVEGLEQLRALEAGMSIRVVPVDYRGRSHASVDNPEDVGLVESIIAAEGELVTCA